MMHSTRRTAQQALLRTSIMYLQYLVAAIPVASKLTAVALFFMSFHDWFGDEMMAIMMVMW